MIGGRLALDFVNTADWRADGSVADEKLQALEDALVWQKAAQIPSATLPDSIGDVLTLRRQLRQMFLREKAALSVELTGYLRDVHLRPNAVTHDLAQAPLLGLVTLSALSILSDPKEFSRVKLCPGQDCGWIFLDETKNGRRKWCMMETCGNRAKASRNYARKSKRQSL